MKVLQEQRYQYGNEKRPLFKGQNQHYYLALPNIKKLFMKRTVDVVRWCVQTVTYNYATLIKKLHNGFKMNADFVLAKA
jgi:hypothetical protein